MDDLARRYVPMIGQIAEIYSGDPDVCAQLRSLVVTREEWDDEGMRGGHFWFDVSAPPAASEDFLVDARAFDVDGAMIDVIIHPVEGILNWGEWYRVPLSVEELEQPKPIQRWPPPWIGPHIAVRKEEAGDVDGISRLTEEAFQNAPHTSHTEQFIANALRRSNQLTISMVALARDRIVRHIAISRVTISSGARGWYGLGPISVLPTYQRQGIGSMLMRASLGELQRLGGVGCVVLGDPAYYGRFGFKTRLGLELPGVPHEYFQAMSFGAKMPIGIVRYPEAFDVTE